MGEFVLESSLLVHLLIVCSEMKTGIAVRQELPLVVPVAEQPDNSHLRVISYHTVGCPLASLWYLETQYLEKSGRTKNVFTFHHLSHQHLLALDPRNELSVQISGVQSVQFILSLRSLVCGDLIVVGRVRCLQISCILLLRSTLPIAEQHPEQSQRIIAST